jgi:MoaA/NifB/PqqE/SkfB family radical SAM enzyme
MHFAFEVNRVNIRFTFLYNIACRHCYNRSGSRGRAHRIELERMLGIF